MEAEWEDQEDTLTLISNISLSIYDRSEIKGTISSNATVARDLYFSQNLGFEFVVLSDE